MHALKGNPSGAACAGQEPKTPARETSSGSTPDSRPGRRPADPSTPKSVHVGGSSTRTKTRTVKAEANGGVLTAVRVEPAGTLPFTGLSLLGAALLALALVAAGLALRRQARA